MDCPICSARPGHDEEVSYGSNSFARVSGLNWTALKPTLQWVEMCRRMWRGCGGGQEELFTSEGKGVLLLDLVPFTPPARLEPTPLRGPISPSIPLSRPIQLASTASAPPAILCSR